MVAQDDLSSSKVSKYCKRITFSCQDEPTPNNSKPNRIEANPISNSMPNSWKRPDSVT
jgi:hypothetical protein